MKLFTSDQRIIQSTKWAEKYFNSDDFIKDVRCVTSFQESNVLPMDILKLFFEFPLKAEIKCTYFGAFFKKVLGRTIGDGFAYINSSSLGRQVWQTASTIVHEVSHVVDEYYPKANFGHGSNSPLGKSKTFPYYIGECAENWIKKEVLISEAEKISILIIKKREELNG